MHQGMCCCYIWLCMSTGFLVRAATCSLGLYRDNLLEACFLMGQLHLGQIMFCPLPHHSKIHHGDYIEGIPLNVEMGGAWQIFDGNSRVCSLCTSPENGVQAGYDMETDTQAKQASQMPDGLIFASKPKF